MVSRIVYDHNYGDEALLGVHIKIFRRIHDDDIHDMYFRFDVIDENYIPKIKISHEIISHEIKKEFDGLLNTVEYYFMVKTRLNPPPEKLWSFYYDCL